MSEFGSTEDEVHDAANVPLQMATTGRGSLEHSSWISLIKALIVGRGSSLEESNNTRFSDLNGLDEAKAELEDIVQYLRNPQQFINSGRIPPKGVLLVGPPGTGKTMLARAIAGETGVPFFSCNGSELSDLKEMCFDVGAMRDNIASAKRKTPCILFINKIDKIDMTLFRLIKELFCFDRNVDGIIIAETNLPDYHELMNPELFDHFIEVPNPDVKRRRQVLEAYTSKVLKAENVDQRIIARETLGFSCTDLANLVKIATNKAEMGGSLTTSMADFEHAKDKIIKGCKDKSFYNRYDLRRTAYHEAGHALLIIYSDAALPLYKITIVPNWWDLGGVYHLESTNERDIAREVVLARIEVCMGGKVAEELIFGELDSNGLVPDCQEATNLATELVTLSLWKKVVAKLKHCVNGKNVDEEVKELLENATKNAKNVLTMHIEELHVLANALVEHETLSSSDQIMDVLAKMKTKEHQIVTKRS